MTEPGAALEVAVRAAQAAGEILLQGRGRDKQISEKNSRTSIVTWADGAAQAEIARVVAEAFPDHSLLGEEGTAGAAGSDSLWVVDPLDGTSNYAHGFPFYCVSVALV
ncbi:MAG: inositol monophosphatase, partial [Chloroflexota bacterium]|nr:inositol monophosphatase [Chloroflexota bacterium]